MDYTYACKNPQLCREVDRSVTQVHVQTYLSQNLYQGHIELYRTRNIIHIHVLTYLCQISWVKDNHLTILFL